MVIIFCYCEYIKPKGCVTVKKLLFSAVIISLLMLCGCTQNAPSPQNELISSNWTASLDGGGELSLKFYGEPGDLSAEFNLKNAGKDVTISGDCLVDSTSIVIFDSSVSQNYAFDYTPKGDTLEISYNHNVLIMQKQS